MIVGVYGVGYLVASRDPWRHWPIVLVGLLGKVFGPMGFVLAASRGELGWSLGWTIITNDLVWWAPFGVILWGALSQAQAQLSPEPEDGPPLSVREALARTRVDGGAGAGRSLLELSETHALLLVFLRHTGCTFCREALADLRSSRDQIERHASIVLVHLGEEGSAQQVFRSYALGEVSRVSDPTRTLYRAFELRRGRFLELFGPSVWLPGVVALLRGHGVGMPEGDAFQMPGVFVVREGRVVAGRGHTTVATRPDYARVSCEA
jgi:peroxiredoxin